MESIAKGITEFELSGGERIFLAPTNVKDVVSFEGSVLGGSNMLPLEKAYVAGMAGELLDAGTKSKKKEVIRGALAQRGASLSFSSAGDRTYFTGSCLPEDLSAVLAIASECLTEASFPASELTSAKERALGDLKEAQSDTRTRASGELSRMLYDAKHVNYSDSIDTKIKRVKETTRADVSSFGKKLGRNGLVLSIVGDITASSARKSVERSFGSIATGSFATTFKIPNKKESTASEKLVFIADKATIDFYLGAAVPLTYDSEQYLPFLVMLNMLGGRGLSGGHLMRTIRERDGYTYGIYASASGFSDGADGAFSIWATFSPQTYEKAVAATRKEIGIFLKSGMTPESLQAKKDQLTGNYLVGLSTTRGIASMLHKIGIENKPLSYIDEYPKLIHAISLEELSEVAKLVQLNKLSLAAAGTFVK